MRPVLSTLLVALPAVLAAQANRLPPLRESPAASVSLDIGLTNVKIDYHRPAVRGREIWGKLVPYGETWRTGANEPSLITFGGDVKVDGKDVPKGTYAFYTIPNKESWTAILSKNTKLWGSYGYDAKDDLLRWTLKPEAKDGKGTEYMSFFLIPTGSSSARVELHWEKVKVMFNVDVDVHGAYRKLVLEKIAAAKPEEPKDGVLYFQAAQYYYKQNLEPAQALAWATIACKSWESFWPFELKARLEEKAGKQAEANADMEKAIALSKSAKNAPPKEYIATLEKDLAAWKAKK